MKLLARLIDTHDGALGILRTKEASLDAEHVATLPEDGLRSLLDSAERMLEPGGQFDLQGAEGPLASRLIDDTMAHLEVQAVARIDDSHQSEEVFEVNPTQRAEDESLHQSFANDRGDEFENDRQSIVSNISIRSRGGLSNPYARSGAGRSSYQTADRTRSWVNSTTPGSQDNAETAQQRERSLQLEREALAFGGGKPKNGVKIAANLNGVGVPPIRAFVTGIDLTVSQAAAIPLLDTRMHRNRSTSTPTNQNIQPRLIKPVSPRGLSTPRLGHEANLIPTTATTIPLLVPPRFNSPRQIPSNLSVRISLAANPAISQLAHSSPYRQIVTTAGGRTAQTTQTTCNAQPVVSLAPQVPSATPRREAVETGMVDALRRGVSQVSATNSLRSQLTCKAKRQAYSAMLASLNEDIRAAQALAGGMRASVGWKGMDYVREAIASLELNFRELGKLWTDYLASLEDHSTMTTESRRGPEDQATIRTLISGLKTQLGKVEAELSQQSDYREPRDRGVAQGYLEKLPIPKLRS